MFSYGYNPSSIKIIFNCFPLNIINTKCDSAYSVALSSLQWKIPRKKIYLEPIPLKQSPELYSLLEAPCISLFIKPQLCLLKHPKLSPFQHLPHCLMSTSSNPGSHSFFVSYSVT